MPQIKNILLALDFSGASEGAAEYALTFAKLTGAHLHVLHVIGILEERQRALIPAEAFQTLQKEVEVQAVRELERFCGTRAAGLSTTSHARIGVPFRVILETAHEVSADLIVLGAYGQSGIENVVVGSTAERVVRRSDIPVLTVRPTA